MLLIRNHISSFNIFLLHVLEETLVEDVIEEKLGEHEEDQGVIDIILTENEDANHHPMRQSRRIKEQGLGHLKMADKAEALQANINLEGNSLKFKNSFAVLENDVLLDRTNKMGINSKKIDLEFFDIMKDLELARANLIERAKEDKQDKTNASSDTDLPFEEIKFITWNSDSSDEEGFKVVSSRKYKRKQKRNSSCKETGCVEPQPIDGVAASKGDVTKIRSGYNLRGRRDLKNKKTS